MKADKPLVLGMAREIRDLRAENARLRAEIDRLRGKVEQLSLAYIEASNRGIDMDEVRSRRREAP